MNWINDPDLLAAEEDLPKDNTLTLRHAKQPKNKSQQENLFETEDFLTTTSTYNIMQPGASCGDSMLAIQNPGLLAFRHKSLKNSRPQVISPVTQKKITTIKMQTTLSKIKPLSSLKDPLPTEDMFNRELKPEELSINFDEDPVAYFSKHKDGHGLRFIYLIYAQDPKDLDFSPYNLKKATSAEIGNNYFMMSATGVTHVDPTGLTESVSLDQWAREESIYQAVRRLKLFNQYHYWYPFTIWKKFVLRRRYEELQTSIKSMPYFRNPLLFSTELMFSYSMNDLKEIISRNLLSFIIHSQSTLKEFEEKCKNMKDELKAMSIKFVTDISHYINDDLYSRISDKKLTEVHDADFWKGRKKSPNLIQILNLEKKKSELRKEKTNLVNQEIMSIGGLIRSVDYMILETELTSCIEAFKKADEMVSSEFSAVFKLEVTFNDEGKIELIPSLRQIENSVTQQIYDSLKLLNSLPRLLHDIDMRPFIRDSGTDVDAIFRFGPALSLLLNSHNEHEDAKNHIIQVIRDSYEESVEATKSFSEFYEVYQCGVSWDVKKFLHAKNGQEYKGVITNSIITGQAEDAFLINNGEEPTVDFDAVKNALQKYTDDEKRIANIRQKTYKGALYIDSSEFTANLAPIPKKALNELKGLISSLAVMKITLLENVLKCYSMSLKSEPKLLDAYISLCALIKKADKLTPTIIEEISFVNTACELLEKYGEGLPVQNTLEKQFAQFQADQQVAISNRASNKEEFAEELKKKTEEIQDQLSNLFTDVSNIPTTLESIECDSQQLINNTEQQKKRALDMQESIKEIVSEQEITEIHINDFDFYKVVLETIDATTLLYQTVKEWERISEFSKSSPFSEIDMDVFTETLNNVSNNIDKLEKSKLKSPLIKQLKDNINIFKPVMNNLNELSKAPLKKRHWESLYQLCEINEPYDQSVSIDKLIKLGILIQTDIIANTTSTAIAEAEIENQYHEIDEQWNKTTISVVETAILSEETLALAPIDPTITEINDALISLNRICSVPYSMSIRNDAIELINMLKSSQDILEAWSLFQENYEILSTVFKSDESKKMLPQQTETFAQVQQQWHLIAKHTIKDTRLFSVCSFPDLYNIIRKSEKTLEEIMSTITPLLDRKRAISPRLNFISDIDLLTLITTKSFDAFSSITSKIFMGISRIDPHESDAEANESIQRLKFYGLNAINGESLSFLHPVNFAFETENLTNELIEAMKAAVKEQISMNLISFPTVSLSEWISSTTTYIAEVVLNIISTKEINDCVKQIEINPKSGNLLVSVYQRRIHDILAIRRPDMPKKEMEKLSSLVIFLSSIRDRINLIVKPRPSYQQELALSSTLRYSFSGSTNEVVIELGTTKWNFGYEFWGDPPCMIFTPEIEESYQELTTAGSLFGPTLIYGPTHIGKVLLGRHLAASFGCPAFVVNSFHEINVNSIRRLVIGTAATGSWTIIAGIEKLKKESLSYIYDASWEINPFNNTGKIYIEGVAHSLLKNSRLLFTSSAPQELSPQIKAATRAVSLRPPNLATIAAIKLSATGFHDCFELATKILAFIMSIRGLFHHNSLVNEINLIIEKAATLKRTSSEESQIASACFDVYESQCHNDVLTHLVYAAFPTGSTFEELVQKIDYARFNEERENLKRLVIKEISRLNVKVPIDSFATSIVTIKQLLENHMCVIVCGPPCTGKTLMLKVLERVMQRPEYKEINQDELPLQIVPCYMQSDLQENMFGKTTNGVFAHGQIISIVKEKYKQSKDHNILLKFDGPITREFDNFITSFLGTPELSTLSFGSLDSFTKKHSPRIIIETSDISQASPALIARSGVVLTYGAAEKHCFMVNPQYTLSNASSMAGDFTNDTITKILEVFQKVAPAIVSQVFNSENVICYSKDTHYTTDDIRIITEIMPVNSAVLALQQFMFNKELLETEDGIVLAIAYSFSRVFAGIFDRVQQDKFEAWLVDRFHIHIEEWPDYIPSKFAKAFPHPTLESCILEFNKLRPLVSSVSKTERFLPYSAFPSLNNTVQCIQAKLNVIVHCKRSYQRNEFIDALLEDNKWIKPIRINSIRNISARSFASFICKHTKFDITEEDYNNQYVLIIENLTKDDVQTMEFIRMILNEKKIRLYSPNDPKYSEYLTLPNLRVIVTTDCINSLPSRFLAKFVPIRIDPYSMEDAKEIASKIIFATGLSNSKVEWICNFMSDVIQTFQTNDPETTLLDSIVSISKFVEKLNPTLLTKAIMAELNMRVLHKLDPDTFRERIIDISHRDIPGAIEKKAVSDFLRFKTVCVNHYVEEKGIIELKEMSYDRAETLIMEENNKLFDNKINVGYMRLYPTSLYNYHFVSRYIETPGMHIIFAGINPQEKLADAKFYAYSHNFAFIHLLKATETTKAIEVVKDAVIKALDGKRTILFLEASCKKDQSKLLNLLCCRFSFIQLFNDSELDEIYKKANNGETKFETYDQCYNVYTKINDTIMKSITLIISMPTLGDYSNEQFAAISSTTITEADVMYYAQHKIESSPALKSYANEYSPNLSEVITNLCKYSPPSLNSVLRLKFIDYCAMFSDMHLENLEIHNKMCTKANRILTDMDLETKSLQSRLNTLNPVLNAIQVDTDTMSRNYTTKKDAIDSRTVVIKNELKVKKDELDEVTNNVEALLDEYKQYEPGIFVTKTAVLELKENDIKTIRIAAEESTTFIKTMFECFCLFLGQEPNYEKNGVKLLNDDNIVKIILEKVKPFTLGPYEQGILDKYFTQKEFTDQHFDSIAPGLKALFDYLQAVEQVTRVRNLIIVECDKLERKQSEYDSKEASTTNELSSLESVAAGLAKENENLQQLLKQREKYEKTQKELSDRLLILTGINDNLNLLRESWEADIKDTNLKERMMMSTILFAYSFIFCFAIEEKERTLYYNSAKGIIDPLNAIKGNIDEFMGTHLNEAFPELFKGRLDCISGTSISTIIALALHSKNTVAVFDRDGFVLKALEKLENTKVVSQSVSNIDEITKEALLNGTKLIITDINKLTPLLIEIVDQQNYEKDTPREIFFNGESIKCHKDSQIILLSAKSPSEIPCNIASRLTIINNNSEKQQVTRDFFYSLFLNYLRKDSQQLLIDALAAERTRKINMTECKKKALEIINRETKDGFLLSNDLINEFNEAKNGYFIGVAESKEVSESSQYLEDIEPFTRHVDLICLIWSIISRSVSKFNTNVIFDITYYGKVITDCLSNDGLMQKPTEAQLVKLRKAILVSSLQMIFKALPLNDSYAVAFRIAVANKLKTTAELEREKICENLALVSTRMNEKLDYEKHKIPEKLDATFMSTVRTSDVILAMSKFISNNTVENFDTFIPPFQMDQCLSSSSDIPTIIFTSETSDPTPVVHMHLMQRVRLDTLVSVSLDKSPDSIAIAEKMLLGTMKVSSTVIVHYSQPNEKAASLISDVFFKAKNGQADPNFRMIIICTSSKYLPDTLVAESKKLNYDEPIMLRQFMQQIFSRYSSSIQSSTNTLQIKKLSYSLMLAISLITCRNAIRPGGYLDSVTPNIISFYDIVKSIPFIVAASPNNIPMENLYIEIKNILMPSIINEFDRKKVDSIVRFVLPPEALDDGFSITKKASSKWTVPGDIPLSSISALIMNLPNLPSGTPFGMIRAAKVIRNWKLGSWFLKPFIRATKFTFDPKDACSNLSNMISLVPGLLHTDISTKYASAKGLFLLHEITKYNSICRSIRESIANAISEIEKCEGEVSYEAEELAKGNIPDSWKKMSGIHTFCSPSSFIAHLNDSYTQLMRWNQDTISPVIDVSCIFSLLELLQANKVEYALENKMILSDIDYDFSISSDNEKLEKGEMILCGLTLVFGKVEDGKIALLGQDAKSPFTQIPGIKCTLKRKQEEEKDDDENTNVNYASHEILIQSSESFASRDSLDEQQQDAAQKVVFQLSHEACSDYTTFNPSVGIQLPATCSQQEFARAGTAIFGLIQEQL